MIILYVRIYFFLEINYSFLFCLKKLQFVRREQVRRQSVKIKKVDFLTRWDAVSCKMALLGVPSDAENRVRRRLVEFLVFNSVYWKKSAPSNGVNRVDLRQT